MEISIGLRGLPPCKFKITRNATASSLADSQVIELEATLVRGILFLVKFKLCTPWLNYVMQITYSVIIKGLMNEYKSNTAF